jgi:hypothetical protein
MSPMKSSAILLEYERVLQIGSKAMPTPRALLSRQISLLAYLTSGPAIFGEAIDEDRAAEGIDPGLLHLVARFSHNKRLEKISGTLPRTLAILGNDRDAIVAAFAYACPQTETGRLENALQFRDFLSALQHDGRLVPPHVAAVATLELACATARSRGDHGLRAITDGNDIGPGIRRGAGVVLLRCPYDLRPIFEDGSCVAAPAERDTSLAITFVRGAAAPQIFELTSFAYDLISRMDDWSDPGALGDSAEIKQPVRDLARRGLIESSP